MDVQEFAWKMMDLMPQIAKGIARYENNYLTQGKITLPQFWMLVQLLQSGESKMSAVAQSVGISKPAATGLIDRLVAQSLAARRDDPKDRRVVWIRITPKGKKIAQDIRAQKHRTLVKIFSEISVSGRAQHLQMMEHIAQTMAASLKNDSAKF